MSRKKVTISLSELTHDALEDLASERKLPVATLGSLCLRRGLMIEVSSERMEFNQFTNREKRKWARAMKVTSRISQKLEMSSEE